MIISPLMGNKHFGAGQGSSRVPLPPARMIAVIPSFTFACRWLWLSNFSPTTASPHHGQRIISPGFCTAAANAALMMDGCRVSLTRGSTFSSSPLHPNVDLQATSAHRRRSARRTSPASFPSPHISGTLTATGSEVCEWWPCFPHPESAHRDEPGLGWAPVS